MFVCGFIYTVMMLGIGYYFGDMTVREEAIQAGAAKRYIAFDEASNEIRGQTPGKLPYEYSGSGTLKFEWIKSDNSKK